MCIRDRECAVEFCSLSKTAGFTGTRCGYTVVPMELKYGDFSLNRMWLRRQTTKFNGVSYVVPVSYTHLPPHRRKSFPHRQ